MTTDSNYTKKEKIIIITNFFIEKLERLLEISILLIAISTVIALYKGEKILKEADLVMQKYQKLQYLSYIEPLSVEEIIWNYIDNLEFPSNEVVEETVESTEVENSIETELREETQLEVVEELELPVIVDNELSKKVEGMTPEVRLLNTSSYCACEECCGKTDGITASGAKATAWYTVAAGKEYEIGTIIYIPDLADKPNGGWFIVQDRGGAISNDKLDIYLDTHSEALRYGRKNLECYIYEF